LAPSAGYGRGARQQIKALKHKTDELVAHACLLIIGHVADINIIQ
jgi:hypothetical protein